MGRFSWHTTRNVGDSPLPQPSQRPSLTAVVLGAISRAMSGIRVALPGRVESYDPTTQRASVKPLIQDGYYDEAGERQTDPLPIVTDVPVAFQGSGTAFQSFPVSVGDTVLLVFCSSSIDKWLVQGGEVDPEDDRRHHLSDAVAIPGFRSGPFVTDPAAWVISADLLKLGSKDANDPVIRKSDLAGFISTYNGHTHVETGSTTNTPLPTQSTINGSSKVKLD